MALPPALCIQPLVLHTMGSWILPVVVQDLDHNRSHQHWDTASAVHMALLWLGTAHPVVDTAAAALYIALAVPAGIDPPGESALTVDIALAGGMELPAGSSQARRDKPGDYHMHWGVELHWEVDPHWGLDLQWGVDLQWGLDLQWGVDLYWAVGLKQ